MLSTLVKCQIPSIHTVGRVLYVWQGFTLSHRRFQGGNKVLLHASSSKPSAFNPLIVGRPSAQAKSWPAGSMLAASHHPVITLSCCSSGATTVCRVGSFFAQNCSDKRWRRDGIPQKSCVKGEGRRLKKTMPFLGDSELEFKLGLAKTRLEFCLCPYFHRAGPFLYPKWLIEQGTEMVKWQRTLNGCFPPLRLICRLQEFIARPST